MTCSLSLINVIAIITTAVLRFRPIGQLCALSTQPTYVDGNFNLTDERTFESDGDMIFALWLSQLIFFFAVLIGGTFFARPAKDDEVDEYAKRNGLNSAPNSKAYA